MGITRQNTGPVHQPKPPCPPGGYAYEVATSNLFFFAAIFSAAIYITSTILAYWQYPQPFSLTQNWLSDLGNQIANPRGAPFYNMGVILTSLSLAIWFAGLSQWKMKKNTVSQRLLAISQLTGIIAAFALIMSALHPIDEGEIHTLWSQIHFVMFGIAFAFSVTALRYHQNFSNRILYLGIVASMLPFLMFTLGKGQTYWMEWVSVGLFILYILTVGKTTRSFAHST